MQSHFLYLCFFAASVGVVLGAMLRSQAREALRMSAWITLALVGTAVVLAWLMYLV